MHAEPRGDHDRIRRMTFSEGTGQNWTPIGGQIWKPIDTLHVEVLLEAFPAYGTGKFLLQTRKDHSLTASFDVCLLT